MADGDRYVQTAKRLRCKWFTSPLTRTLVTWLALRALTAPQSSHTHAHTQTVDATKTSGGACSFHDAARQLEQSEVSVSGWALIAAALALATTTSPREPVLRRCCGCAPSATSRHREYCSMLAAPIVFAASFCRDPALPGKA